MLGPAVLRNLQKFQSELPISVVFVRNERFERAPIDFANDHVVDQPRQIVSQCEHRGRAAGNKWRGRRILLRQSCCPCCNEFRKRQPALQSVESRRNVERRCRSGLSLREFQLILIDGP